jgi:secondary thiamine-phosphate synthase enzyme
MQSLTIQTQQERAVIDITGQISEMIEQESGVVNLFLQHTSAAISTADMDPGGTDQDYLNAWEEIMPDLDYNHPHDPEHMPDHILATTIGSSLSVPVQDGKLQLGTWQKIVLCEFNGPRERAILITETGE